MQFDEAKANQRRRSGEQGMYLSWVYSPGNTLNEVEVFSCRRSRREELPISATRGGSESSCYQSAFAASRVLTAEPAKSRLLLYSRWQTAVQRRCSNFWGKRTASTELNM
ncbi:hypothetical protein PM082_011608 [Marasmius tenuissimus]|nr:hypothetical protein PM082_011608 [Marasmius tenuissimus]